ncbi:MAG: exodeoxyribonuclease III [Alphaproteobacteria bacterium]|nr:exodeoxyribonuclease III [Alphaproteobacteria bacterium]
MQIISWNVASARARLPLLKKLLLEENPDILFLQEIKATEETFPFDEFLSLGYHAYIRGEKGFNGVAILSKKELEVKHINLPTLEDETQQARYIECAFNNIHFISVYVPNGNPPEKDPFNNERLLYKIKWMKALNEHLKTLIDKNIFFVIGGDFNVIEKDSDVYNPELYRQNALMVPPVRKEFSLLQEQGLVNTIRLFNPTPHTYSFWDFQGGCWFKNLGMLLDHIFIPKDKEKRIQSSGILKEYRGLEKPSDHVPVFCSLK